MAAALEPIPGSLVDGLFRRTLGPELTPELKGALRGVGLDLEAPGLPPAVPRELWYRAVELTSAAFFPAEGPAGQLRRLGHHVLDALQARGIARGPWVRMGRVLGPRRVLLQAAARQERSPVKVQVTELSRTRFELWTLEPRQHEFLAGLLEGACRALGGRDPSAQVLGPRGEGTVLLVTWR